MKDDENDDDPVCVLASCGHPASEHIDPAYLSEQYRAEHGSGVFCSACDDERTGTPDHAFMEVS